MTYRFKANILCRLFCVPCMMHSLVNYSDWQLLKMCAGTHVCFPEYIFRSYKEIIFKSRTAFFCFVVKHGLYLKWKTVCSLKGVLSVWCVWTLEEYHTSELNDATDSTKDSTYSSHDSNCAGKRWSISKRPSRSSAFHQIIPLYEWYYFINDDSSNDLYTCQDWEDTETKCSPLVAFDFIQ